MRIGNTYGRVQNLILFAQVTGSGSASNSYERAILTLLYLIGQHVESLTVHCTLCIRVPAAGACAGAPLRVHHDDVRGASWLLLTQHHDRHVHKGLPIIWFLLWRYLALFYIY
jgi:hypothetical protein